MTANDKHTLPKNDECHDTLEAYQRYLTPYIEDFWQVARYKEYLKQMEQWQQCCPGRENSSIELRPDKTPVESFAAIRLPSLFSAGAPCGGIFDKNSHYSAIATAWFYDYSSERAYFWSTHYSDINKNLYACCTMRFNRCLEQAVQQQGSEGVLTSAASARCLEAFSPEYQQQAAAERAAAQAKQESGAVAGGREGKETAATGQSAACTVELSRVRQERSQCKLQAELTAQQDKSEIMRLTAEVTEAHNESARRDARLQGVLTEPTPRSESDVLAHWPSGTGSSALVLLGILVLTAGYFLGWPGRSRRARRVSGGVSALTALSVYLLSVALLPDTQFFELLLAVTFAVLFVAFRALVRSQWELRLRGPPSPSP